MSSVIKETFIFSGLVITKFLHLFFNIWLYNIPLKRDFIFSVLERKLKYSLKSIQ